MLTPEEANRLLPRVREWLALLRSRRVRVQELEQKKAVEQLAWLQKDGTVSSKAQQEVARLEAEQQREARLFERELREMVAAGAALKDLEEGLVDFLTERADEVVFLCWKEGEEQIGYWHDQASGFPGRRPIREL